METNEFFNEAALLLGQVDGDTNTTLQAIGLSLLAVAQEIETLRESLPSFEVVQE